MDMLLIKSGAYLQEWLQKESTGMVGRIKAKMSRVKRVEYWMGRILRYMNSLNFVDCFITGMFI